MPVMCVCSCPREESMTSCSFFFLHCLPPTPPPNLQNQPLKKSTSLQGDGCKDGWSKKTKKQKRRKERDDAREKVGRSDKGRICLPSRCVSKPPASLISAEQTDGMVNNPL